jgi:hypothetical protein
LKVIIFLIIIFLLLCNGKKREKFSTDTDKIKSKINEIIERLNPLFFHVLAKNLNDRYSMTPTDKKELKWHLDPITKLL